MRFILFFGLTIIIHFGCGSKTGKTFFDYDEIVHYTNDFDAYKLNELYDNQSKTGIDSLKLNVITGKIPQTISDQSFIDKLGDIGYSRRKVDKTKFLEIDKIFIEKTVDENLATSCVSIYRDILLFKKQNKVVGVAKICFECLDSQIVGTTANTENFGQDGDYKRLANF